MSEPVKVFWCEPTGRYELRIQPVARPGEYESIGPFTKEEAEAESSRLFEAGAITSSGRIPIYRGDGREFTLSDAPPGAMWDADWRKSAFPEDVGPDGLSLIVVCPDGWHWCVDSEASNCTRKGDRTHKCWVRHGDPRTGDIHVDKNGATCAAGAGSILTPKWHGFLHHGHLVA